MACWTLKLGFGYSQIWVFDSALHERFTKWTTKHVDQGFAWREGSASFLTLIEAGVARLRILVSVDPPGPSQDAVRVIEVPFDVPGHGRIEVGGFSSRTIIDVSPGRYTLRFEAFAPDSPSECRIDLAFVKDDKPGFRIVRADPALRLEGQLLTTAAPLRFPPGLADQPPPIGSSA
jgi:hypothetical protein